MSENSNSVGRGVVSTILFGKETSYGTGGTAAKDIGLVQTCTISPDSTTEERFGAGQANSVYVKGGLVNVKGSVEAEYQHARPLEWGFYGGTTTHADTTGDCTHTMVWSNSLPSLAGETSVEMGTNDIAQKYTGLLFGSSTLSCNVDGVLKFQGDFSGQNITTGTTAAAAVVNTGAPLGGFESSLTMGGSLVKFTQSWSITVNRNSKHIFGAGDRKAMYGASHLANVSWKASIGLENTTQIARLLGTVGTGGITTSEPPSFTNIFAASNGIAVGSGARSVSLTLSGCQVKDWNINYQKGDFVIYDISGMGQLSTGVCVDQILTAAW